MKKTASQQEICCSKRFMLRSAPPPRHRLDRVLVHVCFSSGTLPPLSPTNTTEQTEKSRPKKQDLVHLNGLRKTTKSVCPTFTHIPNILPSKHYAVHSTPRSHPTNTHASPSFSSSSLNVRVSPPLCSETEIKIYRTSIYPFVHSSIRRQGSRPPALQGNCNSRYMST